jgi:hypothetical protein
MDYDSLDSPFELAIGGGSDSKRKWQNSSPRQKAGRDYRNCIRKIGWWSTSFFIVKAIRLIALVEDQLLFSRI